MDARRSTEGREDAADARGRGGFADSVVAADVLRRRARGGDALPGGDRISIMSSSSSIMSTSGGGGGGGNSPRAPVPLTTSSPTPRS